MKNKLLYIFFIITMFSNCLSDENYNARLQKEMKIEISKRIIDSVKIGLDIYYKNHKHYPITSDKYFLDSIKYWTNIDAVYLYKDSISLNQDTITLKKKSMDEINIVDKNVFIGIGQQDNRIIYSCNDGLRYSIFMIH